MTKTKALKIAYNVYTVAFSIVTVLLGALFVWQVVDLYYDGVALGGQIYTREKVANRLAKFALPVLLWIIMAIVEFVLYVVKPIEAKKVRKVDPTLVAKNLKKRMPAQKKEECSAQYALIEKEERAKKIGRLIFATIAFIAVVYGVAYLANDKSFTNMSNATVEVLKMVKYLFPVALVVLALLMLVLDYEKYSASVQIDALKVITKGEKASEQKKGIIDKINDFFDKPVVTFTLRISVLATGVAFVILGIFNGSMSTVLNKAINICTECIGLG